MKRLAALALVALAAGCIAPSDEEPSPLVAYAPGADAAFADLHLADDGASFAATLRGVPGATVTLDELVTLRVVDGATREVTITAPRVADPLVTAYALEWTRNGDVVATLDLKAAAPTATFILEPGASLSARAMLTLAGAPTLAPLTLATSVR